MSAYDKLVILSFLFPENKVWTSKQIVQRDNLHGISKFIFCEKYEKKKKILQGAVCWNLNRLARS